MKLKDMGQNARRDALVDRMKNELGYEHVMPWQIFKRKTGGIIMYYMIHATDHPEAPVQMSRAYRNTMLPLEPVEQLELWAKSKGPDSDPGATPASNGVLSA